MRGERVVERMRARIAEEVAAQPLGPEATDAELLAAVDRAVERMEADRRLRRVLRQDRMREVARILATGDVVSAAVGLEAADDRLRRLQGLPPVDAAPPQPTPSPSPSPAQPRRPALPEVRESPRRVAARPRQLPPPGGGVPASLLEAVQVEANPVDDPRRDLGYDHAVWLEEWLGFAVGEDIILAGLEAAVAAHPQVLDALHEDREQLFVAAPALHPSDVRTIVVGALAGHFDEGWEQRLD